MKVLAGDVGGTNARLALVDVDEESARVRHRRDFESEAYDGLAPVVQAFLAEIDEHPPRASFGIACPIVDGRCRFPNLDWVVEIQGLRDEIGVDDVRLINDFDALSHSLAYLEEHDLATLQEGVQRPEEPVAVIGAGTGLGHGFVTRAGDRPRVHSSEGGHVDLAARTPLEDGLVDFLRREHGRASYERVVSGPGLVDVYRYLAAEGWAPERPDTRRAVQEAGEDAALVVSERGLAGTDELCVRALDIFVSVFGAQAGNLALTVQARGGVYLGGGIAPDILEKLMDGSFLEAFRSKGRFRAYVEEIPVRVVMNDDAGLLGAAGAALHGGGR